jgi:hypothetical protein
VRREELKGDRKHSPAVKVAQGEVCDRALVRHLLMHRIEPF